MSNPYQTSLSFNYALKVSLIFFLRKKRSRWKKIFLESKADDVNDDDRGGGWSRKIIKEPLTSIREKKKDS